MPLNQSTAQQTRRYSQGWTVAWALAIGSLVFVSCISVWTPTFAEKVQQDAYVSAKGADVGLAGRPARQSALIGSLENQHIDLPAVDQDEVPTNLATPEGQGSLLLPSEMMDPIAVRRQILEALIFLGDDDSRDDVDIGPRTERAIRTFQERLGAQRTGQLLEWQMIELFHQAASLRQQHGLRQLADGQ